MVNDSLAGVIMPADGVSVTLIAGSTHNGFVERGAVTTLPMEKGTPANSAMAQAVCAG